MSLALALFFAFFTHAADTKDPRPEMQILAQEITAVQKYLLSESRFAAKENEEAIKKSLSSITTHINGMKSGAFANDPALKVNLDLLNSHMSDANQAFNEGKKSFARYMLQSSVQMCIACHTRHKTYDFALPDADLGDISDADKAQYFFATRQFEKGKALHEKIISGFPGSGASIQQVRNSLLSLAVFYARIKSDPLSASAYFDKQAKRSDLPKYLSKEIVAWNKEFSSWAGEKKKALKTDAEKMTEAKRLLRKDDFNLVGDSDRSFHVRRLRASALLHEVLEAPGEKSPRKGEALYYLGQIYQRISHIIFFRFGEMYLEACVREYSKTSTARDCYVALEQAVSEGYTGSSGTDIPDNEQVRLMQLKRLAY
jgi:hypothetical protein